jgi:polysaccharide export outer membrane protein
MVPPGGNAPAAQAADQVIAASTPGSAAYKIGPMDVLDISVFKVPELSRSVVVSGTGTVNLPLVGEMVASGMTTRQMEHSLAAKLGAKYLQNPQVTVVVKEYNSQRVTISGEIKKPGVYPIMGQTSLLQLVAMAGGFEASSDSTVLVLRQNDGKRSAAKFNVSDIQKGRADDPTMQAGDVVVAGTSTLKKGFNSILKALPIAGAFALL